MPFLCVLQADIVGLRAIQISSFPEVVLSYFIGFVYTCFRAFLDALFRAFFLTCTMIRVAHACCPHSLNLESLGRIMSVGHGALQRLDRGPAPVTDDVPQHTFGTHV